jgi:hypothetical protein
MLVARIREAVSFRAHCLAHGLGVVFPHDVYTHTHAFAYLAARREECDSSLTCQLNVERVHAAVVDDAGARAAWHRVQATLEAMSIACVTLGDVVHAITIHEHTFLDQRRVLCAQANDVERDAALGHIPIVDTAEYISALARAAQRACLEASALGEVLCVCSQCCID